MSSSGITVCVLGCNTIPWSGTLVDQGKWVIVHVHV